MAKFDPRKAWDKGFKPYAASIGYLVREWNSLQENLCDLFCAILEPRLADEIQPGDKIEVIRQISKMGTAYRAIWYAVQHDRTQRKMLLDVSAKLLPENIHKEVQWLLRHATGVGSQRDDAVHSPFALQLGTPLEFVASTFHGHPRATALQGKKLMDEFESYTKRASILRDHAFHLRCHVLACYRSPDAPPPLPERPAVPDSPGKKPKVSQPQSSRPKSPRRPPQASQA